MATVVTVPKVAAAAIAKVDHDSDCDDDDDEIVRRVATLDVYR